MSPLVRGFPFFTMRFVTINGLFGKKQPDVYMVFRGIYNAARLQIAVVLAG
jgi:hypothetical protein